MAKKRDTIEAEVIDEPFAPSAANRVRASKLRAMVKAGGILSPEDAAWLADYDEARGRKADERAFGASRGKRTTFTEEEHEAVGEGSAAAEMAAAGAMVREEGRRYDSLISVGITALRHANDMQARMNESMLKRAANLEDAHVEMMRVMTKMWVRNAELEAELVRKTHELEPPADEKKDAITEMAEQMMPFIIAQVTEKLGGGGTGGG